jgi:hypothetical protein
MRRFDDLLFRVLEGSKPAEPFWGSIKKKVSIFLIDTEHSLDQPFDISTKAAVLIYGPHHNCDLHDVISLSPPQCRSTVIDHRHHFQGEQPEGEDTCWVTGQSRKNVLA